jgi:hypothetical protein
VSEDIKQASCVHWDLVNISLAKRCRAKEGSSPLPNVDAEDLDVNTLAPLVEDLTILNVDDTLVQLTEDPTTLQIDENLARLLESLSIPHSVTAINDPVDQLADKLTKICLKQLTDVDVSDGVDFSMDVATIEDELQVSSGIGRTACSNILCMMKLDHIVHGIGGGNHQSGSDKRFGAISTSRSGACS